MKTPSPKTFRKASPLLIDHDTIMKNKMNLHFIGKEFECLERLEDFINYQYEPKSNKRLGKRNIYYNQTLENNKKKELTGELFVIRPPHELNIGSMEHEPSELRRVYEIGVQTMEERINELKKYLYHICEKAAF